MPMLPTPLGQPGSQPPRPVAAAVRRLVVPDAAPPYDDEQPSDNEQRSDAEQPYNDVSYASEPGADEPGAAEPGAGEPGAGERIQAGQPSPDNAGHWPSQFAQVLAETLAGSRPAHQLTPWTTEQARQRIRQLGPALVSDQRPRVRRVVTSAPSQDVLELTAVVGFGSRVRALAFRLERGETRSYRATGERWCCTAIESA